MKNLKEYISKLSYDFSKDSLDEKQVAAHPLVQFESWFTEAITAQVSSPNAMTLSTASREGIPSARVLLLRDFNEKGFVFYTNYHSRKAMDMEGNPNAAITFFWPEQERQIRIEGTIEKQDSKDSDDYFSLRPTGSRLGAWASPQSAVIAGRDVLEQKYEEMKKRFGDAEVPRPQFWGGYIVKPHFFEFWQGRPSRMHDRICYQLQENKSWQIKRLAP